MALRVLLADESSTIKKVMQLALQDFAVEVKAVPVGVDVIPVAKSWKPDLIFADVLLQKKSGYDLCAEIKADAELTSVPVVLMWSGFMEIDAAKVTQCRSERQLEKPFDAETLRKIVKELVPKLSNNKISDFLTYPKLPEFVDADSTVIAAPLEVDEPEDFTQVPLPKVKDNAPAPSNTEPWSAGSLDKFRIQIPKEEYVEMDPTLADLDDAQIQLAGAGEIQLGDLDETKVRHAPTSSPRPRSTTFEQPTMNTSSASLIDPVHAEQILREQVKLVLQDIAWKILPDMAERVIKEEIQKLLKDAEKLS